MGFLTPKPRYEPTSRPQVSITGRPNFVAENIGGVSRRALLMASAVRQLADHPLAQPSAAGQPLGDGVGMESVALEMKKLFAKEQSLVRWVALRGALLFLQMSFSPEDWATACATVGIGSGADGELCLLNRDELPDQQVQACVGLCASIESKLQIYDELEHMSLSAVLQDPRFSGVGTAVGYDYIGWTAIVILRSGPAEVTSKFGEPGRIDSPGWYTEPMFSKSERYYDGSDWTDRCRLIQNGREMLLTTPLR